MITPRAGTGPKVSGFELDRALKFGLGYVSGFADYTIKPDGLESIISIINTKSSKAKYNRAYNFSSPSPVGLSKCLLLSTSGSGFVGPRLYWARALSGFRLM